MNYAGKTRDDDVEYTAITLASINLNLRTVDLLLEYGARVDVDNPLSNCVNLILLHSRPMDLYLKAYVIATRLIDRGAVIDPEEDQGNVAISCFLKNTGLITDNPVIISVCQSLLRLILMENAIKIPNENYVQVEFSEIPTLAFIHFPHVEMCPYLYENGYRIKQIEDAINSEKIQRTLTTKLKKLLTRIQEMKKWNLQRLCRRVVRKALGPPLTKKIPELPLPRILKNYVSVDLKFGGKIGLTLESFCEFIQQIDKVFQVCEVLSSSFSFQVISLLFY